VFVQGPSTDRARVSADRPISVVLVDDEPLIRAALSDAMRRNGVNVVGEAGGGREAVALVVERRPDVVLMEVRLPDVSGVDAIHRIGLLAPTSRVLVLTRDGENHVVEAIVAGATGYILKTAPPDAVLRAVRATAAGEAVLSPKIAVSLVQRIREREIPVTASHEDAADAIRAVLTERELEIFRRLASGESNQAIGRELSLSSNTISNHVASILAKLHLDNRIQAAVQAVRSGIA
jgi:DNA-binding NarL/FixJ family response regulator